MKKSILILGAGQEQAIAINEAKKLGYRVIACDENAAAPGLNLADVGLVQDIRHVDSLVRVGEKYEIKGVFSHAVEIPDIVAKVATSLKLNGLLPEVAELCTNKHLRIAALKRAGVPVADFCVASNKNELIEIAESFGYPLVIKPINTSGSRGVQLVKAADFLISAYNEAMQFTTSSVVLVEQYLTGSQVSTESIVFEGNVYTFALADRNYAKEELFSPYFIEDGIDFPSILSNAMQDRIIALVEQTIKVLGIDFGAAKGDIIISDGVPHIIEMASRTSGGWFGAGSIPIATGVNALKPLMQMSMGDKPDLTALSPTRMLSCAQRYWIPQQDAIFHSVGGFDSVKAMPGVQMFNTFFPSPGTRIYKARHHAQRYAQVICTGKDRDEAAQRAELAIGSIKVEQTLL